jgi:TolB protein
MNRPDFLTLTAKRSPERTAVRSIRALPYILSSLLFTAPSTLGQSAASPIGAFDGQSDIGTVLHPGSAVFDSSNKTYTIAGSGENMWFASDAFHFIWTKASGDLSLTADVSFLGTGGNKHRKGVLMIRQSLDPDSIYADVALHGDGLTSLQFRDDKGGLTHEVQSNLSAPGTLRIEKRGDYFFMSLAPKGGKVEIASGSVRIPIQGSYYVGLGVCSHDKDAVEKATFSNVALHPLSAGTTAQPVLYSALETVSIASTDRRVIYVAPGRFEAPNWMPDGKSLLFNRNGRIERLALAGGTPQVIDTGFANRCNNDHGISPDGSQLVISDSSQEDHRSRVYVLPIGGGTPRRITELSPSYWHGWSPDGRTLAFVGERNGEFDIYTLPASGGPTSGEEETRLTTAKGLDDGPEYTPDGTHIYFNSERTGSMQLWRMRADGSAQEQITSDEYNNWFPHISPDSKWMVFLTYDKSVTGHPENKDVMLRLMSMSDQKITVLAKLFGGQGTINVPSWSPDSKQLAFVSYVLVSPEDTH